MDLLAAEITAVTGRDPSEHYRRLAAARDTPYYTRIDVPASQSDRTVLAQTTRAPGNSATIGGLEVIAASGWFAVRPSSTESLYKIYAESFRDPAHLDSVTREAAQIVSRALAQRG